MVSDIGGLVTVYSRSRVITISKNRTKIPTIKSKYTKIVDK